jgi:SWI/SNF-related matrix-associated actin-dependent regulator of chromatin subfamily A3
MPPKRPVEAIDLTDDSPFYSSQPYTHASSSQHPLSSQGYAHSQSHSSPVGRAPKQPRTAAYNRTPSGASQQDPVYIDDDDEEDASASQGMNEQEYAWTLYGNLHGKIVGVRYYNGYATVGEMVVVRREPHNQYDSNAIQVLNVQGTQIGHLPRTISSKLAKYMDNRSLLIEAVITGEKGAFECPLELVSNAHEYYL